MAPRQKVAGRQRGVRGRWQKGLLGKSGWKAIRPRRQKGLGGKKAWEEKGARS